MIFYDCRRGFSPKQSIERLRVGFGDEAAGLRTVYGWFEELKFDRISSSDEFRGGTMDFGGH